MVMSIAKINFNDNVNSNIKNQFLRKKKQSKTQISKTNVKIVIASTISISMIANKQKKTKTNILKFCFGNFIFFQFAIEITIEIDICYLIILTFISSTFLSDKSDGAPNNKSSLEPVFGKAITSLMDAFFSKIIINRSIPHAIPPCGGAPY